MVVYSYASPGARSHGHECAGADVRPAAEHVRRQIARADDDATPAPGTVDVICVCGLGHVHIVLVAPVPVVVIRYITITLSFSWRFEI